MTQKIRRKNPHLACIIAAILLGIATPDAGAINKCVDKAGKITYQEGKCPDGARQNVLKPPPPLLSPDASSKSSSPSGPAADDDREDPAILNLVSVQVGYEGCAGASPDFAQRHEAVHAAWRAANATALSRLERSGRYQFMLENGRRQLRTQPMDRASLARFCEAQFIPELKRQIALRK